MSPMSPVSACDGRPRSCPRRVEDEDRHKIACEARKLVEWLQSYDGPGTSGRSARRFRADCPKDVLPQFLKISTQPETIKIFYVCDPVSPCLEDILRTVQAAFGAAAPPAPLAASAASLLPSVHGKGSLARL